MAPRLKAVVLFAVFLVACQVAVFSLSAPAPVPLEVGYYRTTCPRAEKIVRRTVEKAVAKDHGLAASLIRLYFHDCFVRGCDASILLDSTPGSPSEKLSLANPSLRGYEVIDDAKAAIEARCPVAVSCADIVAFAARDSTFLAGGRAYPVPSGRRDGTVSLEFEVVLNLPSPTSTAQQLIASFAAKGLSADDMVVLSGAHSVGLAHCSSFESRLYNFNATHRQDPSMDPKFARFLKSSCVRPSSNVSFDATVPMDAEAPERLDVEYYENLREGKGLLASDQALAASPRTAALVAGHAESPPSKWKDEFAAAMVRMGYVDVLTGSAGEVRRNCRVVNKK